MRSHWSFRNLLHRVPDMAFREAESRFRTGHAAYSLSIRRRLGLKLLRSWTSIAGRHRGQAQAGRLEPSLSDRMLPN